MVYHHQSLSSPTIRWSVELAGAPSCPCTWPAGCTRLLYTTPPLAPHNLHRKTREQGTARRVVWCRLSPPQPRQWLVDSAQAAPTLERSNAGGPAPHDGGPPRPSCGHELTLRLPFTSPPQPQSPQSVPAPVWKGVPCILWPPSRQAKGREKDKRGGDEVCGA